MATIRDPKAPIGALAGQTSAWIPAMVHRIVQGFHPVEVKVFGSQARDDANEHSDIDLLVVMPDGLSPQGRRDTAIAIARALRDMPVVKDVVVTTPADIARRGDVVGTVLSYALEEGQTVYERR